MKRPLEDAAELFRANESLAGSAREKADLYRGLSLLAEGIRRFQKQLAKVETEPQEGPSHFHQRCRTRLIRKEGRLLPATKT